MPNWKPVIIDADRPLPDLCADGASHVLATVMTAGRPVGNILVPVAAERLPPCDLQAAIEAELVGLLQQERQRAALLEGAPPRKPPSATLLICTRDRPDDLRRCLASVRRLDPPVDEVLVVDNGSSPDITREIVEQAGARYVQEPVRGLDRARNRGILEATGEVLLCTDDDVEVEPGWASALLKTFEDPLVMVATGLVLPAHLDTPARWYFEQHCSFARGWQRRVFDGSIQPSAMAPAAGAGASMALRTAFILSIGGFPEELDAGTLTRSGGDTYLFYRALRAGYRIVYEPASMARHTHRDSMAELVHVYRGYGTGMVSWATRAGIRDHDLITFTLANWWGIRWLWQKFSASVLLRPGALPLQVALAGLHGAFAAPYAFRRASRHARTNPPLIEESAGTQPNSTLGRPRGKGNCE